MFNKFDAIDENIIEDVKREMDRQIAKWGVQMHKPVVWNLILGEEVGEVAKAVLEADFQGRLYTTYDNYRKELVQVAAVAISAIRALDMSTK